MAGGVRGLGVLFFLTLSAVYGQLNSRSVLSSSSLSRVVVSRLTGDVFLTDQDTVYLLPGDLSEITSNVSRTAGETPEGMALSKQEDKLIVCWASAVQSGGETSNDAPCVVYNSTDLLQLQTLSANNLPVGAARGNPYLVSQGFGEGERETFYVMSADDRRLFHRKYRISDGARAAEAILFSDITGRRYVGGATVGNFSYFVTNTVEDGTTVLRVVRVCDVETTSEGVDSVWDSWYEVQVICGTTTGSLADFDNELSNANFLYPSNGADGPLLVVSVTSLSGAVVSSSAFCAVPLSAIDASARSMFNYCVNNNDAQLQFPWTNIGKCSSAVSVPACVQLCCSFINWPMSFCCPQESIKECDLLVESFVNLGPGRLATQLTNPLSGFEVIQESQPFLSLSRRVSSSEVFVVDEVVVIFVGLSNGHVQKVYCCVTCVWYTYQYVYIVCVIRIIHVHVCVIFV